MEIHNLHADELFKNLTTNSKEIEQSLSEYPLDVTKKPNVFIIERKMRLPLFAVDFYHFIYKNGRIPMQDEFIDYYLKCNEEYLNKVIIFEDYEKGLYGRLCRTYPSLVRDVHLFVKLRESDKFDYVDFNIEVDLFGKADILIKHHMTWYGVKLRTKTKRSAEFAAIKDSRGAVELGYVPIEMPIDLDKAFSLQTQQDSLKLYHDGSIEEIYKFVEQTESSLRVKDLLNSGV